MQGVFYKVTEECYHITVIVSSALSPLLWSRHLVPMCVHNSEETVHALHNLAAIVHTFRPDALAAGIVKPAVLGSSH